MKDTPHGATSDLSTGVHQHGTVQFGREAPYAVGAVR